jgi:hypothetical protein
MAARRTPRQLVFDSWAEKRVFQPEVMDLIRLMGGTFMHPNEAQVRAGKTITPTNVPWPDLTIWFPGIDGGRRGGLHLVELKSHDNPKLRGGQPELFASLGEGGAPVLIWEPRHLDAEIPLTLASWAGRPPPEIRYPGPTQDEAPLGFFVPKTLKLRAQLKACDL